MSTDSAPRPSLKERLKMATKAMAAAADGTVDSVVDDATHYANLMEVLTPYGLPKGVKGGRIGIYIHNDRLQMCLSWPEVGQIAFIPLDRLSDALPVAESLLDTGDVKWIRDRKTRKL